MHLPPIPEIASWVDLPEKSAKDIRSFRGSVLTREHLEVTGCGSETRTKTKPKTRGNSTRPFKRGVMTPLIWGDDPPFFKGL